MCRLPGGATFRRAGCLPRTFLRGVFAAAAARLIPPAGGVTFSPPKKSPKSRLKPRFQDFLFRGAFYEGQAGFRPVRYALFHRCTDGAMCRLPGGTTFPHADMPATDIVRKNARGRDAIQPPQGVRWNNARSRHRQVLETSRRRSRHIERTVQFASFGAQCRSKPLSLLWKRETVSSLSKGKRRNGVGRPSPPQRRNPPAARRRRTPRRAGAPQNLPHSRFTN